MIVDGKTDHQRQFSVIFDNSVFLAKLALCMCTVNKCSQYNPLSIAPPQIRKYIWYEVYSGKKKSCTIYIWKKIKTFNSVNQLIRLKLINYQDLIF